MRQAESSENVCSGSLSQPNYVLDMQKVQHRHQVLAENLQAGEWEAVEGQTKS